GHPPYALGELPRRAGARRALRLRFTRPADRPAARRAAVRGRDAARSRGALPARHRLAPANTARIALVAAGARLLDDARVLRAQRAVASRPGVRALGEAFCLREVALLQAYAGELLPEARIARLDAQRALERRCGLRETPGGGIAARAVHEPRDRHAFLYRRRWLRRCGRRLADRRRLRRGAGGNQEREEGDSASHRPSSRSSQLFAFCTVWSTASITAPAGLALLVRGAGLAGGANFGRQETAQALRGAFAHHALQRGGDEVDRLGRERLLHFQRVAQKRLALRRGHFADRAQRRAEAAGGDGLVELRHFEPRELRRAEQRRCEGTELALYAQALHGGEHAVDAELGAEPRGRRVIGL